MRLLKRLRASGPAAKAAGEPSAQVPVELEAPDRATIETAKPFTMTSVARLASLVKAVHYLHDNRIDGDIIECGVWRGGSMMAAALTLRRLGDTSRVLHLFDTFEGMPAPTEHDRQFDGRPAADLLRASPKDQHVWAVAGLDEVRTNLLGTGYPADRVRFIRGKVEDTIPARAQLPERIALLRLDTDWYESTSHELEHLYPRLVRGGVLIIDDYGHWQGARRAVDEFFKTTGPAPLLNVIDYTGRIGVKP